MSARIQPKQPTPSCSENKYSKIGRLTFAPLRLSQRPFSGRGFPLTQLDTLGEGAGNRGRQRDNFVCTWHYPSADGWTKGPRNTEGQRSPQVRINKLPAWTGRPQPRGNRKGERRSKTQHAQINKRSELRQRPQQDQAPSFTHGSSHEHLSSRHRPSREREKIPCGKRSGPRREGPTKTTSVKTRGPVSGVPGRTGTSRLPPPPFSRELVSYYVRVAGVPFTADGFHSQPPPPPPAFLLIALLNVSRGWDTGSPSPAALSAAVWYEENRTVSVSWNHGTRTVTRHLVPLLPCL